MLTKIKCSFEGKNIQRKYSVLAYKIDLQFHDDRLVIEIDKTGQKDRSIGYEIKMQKAVELEKELACKFAKYDADKEGIFKAINEIFRHIKQLFNKVTNESFIGKISIE